MKSKLLLFIAVILVTSCNKPELSPGDFNAWVENPSNNLQQTKTIGKNKFVLQYRPYEYILNIENVRDYERERRREEINGMHYFHLKIQLVDKKRSDILKNTVSSLSEHQRALYYFSYAFNENIFMVEGKDTLKCELYHFIRDNASELNFVFGFENTRREMDHQVVIHDEFFRNGLVKFSYEEQLLNNIPNINLHLL